MSEATSIDKLSIEIESNSSNAAQNIGALADKLGELRKNGSIGVACKNLERLAESLKKLTPVTSNANKLSALAKSITDLSSAGSIAKVVNQLSKLPEALRGLSKLNVDNSLGSKLQSLATAMTPLSQVKAGGIGTIANALTKLQSIDLSKIKFEDTAIEGFVAEIKKLDSAIGPLSTKMNTIGNTFNLVNASARSARSGVSAFDGTVRTAEFNVSNFINVVRGAINTLMPLVRFMGKVIGEAIEWDGISARFGRGFGDQAEEVYSWIQRLNQEMGINVQQFMQYSSVFSTMLQGFGVGTEDAGKMALGYTELIYDIWAGYNDVYKNFSDAADAVKSAIAGEVEPIRRAGFTIVESTLEQTAANYGLEISLESATEAQKSYLRYLTLVDQAHAQNLVGTYARELNTAEGLVRTLAQQLKSLAQAFGSVFLPVLAKVLPWLQAFVDLLTEAIIAVAGFFGIEIQPVSWGSSVGGGVGALDDVANAAGGASGALDDTANSAGAAKDAIEDLKKATIGIDELNVISPPNENSGSGSGGSGGSGGGGSGEGGIFDGLDVDSLWDEAIFDQIQSKVDEIKQKLQDWLPIIGTIGGALAGLGIATLLKHMGDALEKMNLLQKLFASVAIVAIEAALVFTFADNYLESGNFLYLIGEALVTAAAGYLMFKAWGPGGAALALGVSIAAQLVAIHLNLADGTIDLSSDELWIQALTTTLMGAFGGMVLSKYTGFFAKEGFMIGLGVTLSLVMMAINTGAIESGEIDTNSFESWIMQAISVAGAGMTGFTVGKAVAGASGGKTGLLIGITVGLVLNLTSVAGAKGEDFGNNASDWLNAIVTGISAFFTGKKLWTLLGPVIKSAFSFLVGKVTTWLVGGGGAALLAKIEAALVSIPGWGWVAAAVVAVIAGAIGLAITDYDFTEIGEKIGSALGWVIKNLTPIGWGISIGKWLVNAVKDAIEWFKQFNSFDEFCDAVIEGITSWIEDLGDWWDDFVEAGRNIVEGIVEGISSGWDNLCGNLGEFFSGFWKGFCEAFGIASPAKKMKPIGRYIVEGIWEGITGAFSWIKEKISGWCEDVLAEFSSLFSGSGKSGEFKINVKLIKDGWKTVKGWIGSIPVVQQAVKLAKSGWSTVKNWIGSIPAVPQLVKLAKSGWSSVKKWIGSIPAVSQAVKLVKSGWSSVKKWVGSIPTLSAGIKLVKNGWTSVKKWLGSLNFDIGFKLPKIGIKWGKTKIAGFTIEYPKSFYTYAKGGFPDIGEMFIAREAGPEMVGKIGSKTTVANNDQIVEGISEGVYSAVLSAMNAMADKGGNQAINVYLDGKQITSVVEQRQRERGASIMGSQVYSY